MLDISFARPKISMAMFNADRVPSRLLGCWNSGAIVWIRAWWERLIVVGHGGCDEGHQQNLGVILGGHFDITLFERTEENPTIIWETLGNA